MAKNSPSGRRKSDEDVFVAHVAALTHGDKDLLKAYLKGYQEGAEHYRIKGRTIMDANELTDRVANQLGTGFTVGTDARLDAVRELARLNLPGGEPEDLERESVPCPDDLLP